MTEKVEDQIKDNVKAEIVGKVGDKKVVSDSEAAVDLKEDEVQLLVE